MGIITRKGRRKRGGKGREERGSNHCFSGRILGYFFIVNLPNLKERKKKKIKILNLPTFPLVTIKYGIGRTTTIYFLLFGGYYIITTYNNALHFIPNITLHQTK